MALVTNGLTIPPAGTVNSTSSSADDRQLPVAGARSVVPLVYGTDRISGLVLNVLPAGANSTTLLVQVLWCFACAGVSDVRLNGQALPAGSTVTHYLGSQSTADSALVTAFAAQGISYTTTLAGYAYSVVAMPTRAFDGELAITGLVQGRKLYDPRKDSTAGGSGIHRLDTPATWEHSDNPGLALADFLSNATYGAGEAVVWSSVATLANANDALVGTSPPEKRRTLGLSLIKAAPVRDWAETLRAYAGAWLVPTGSGLSLVPDAAGSAVATYTHAAGQIEAIEPLQLRDLGDSPTVVEVIYTDTSAVPWRDASAVATLSGAGTTKPWRVSPVRLPGIQRYSQAMREATERLNKLNLSTITTRVTLFDEAAAHDKGDIISLTHPCGLAGSLFRVLASERLQSGSWALELAQYSAAVYSDAVVTRTSFGDPSFVNPAGPPSTPTGLSVSVTAAGNVIRWNANPESDVLAYELRVGGTDWASATPLVGSTPTRVGGTSYVWAPPSSATYTLRLVAIDGEGLQSEAATLTTVIYRVDSIGQALNSDRYLRAPEEWVVFSGTAPVFGAPADGIGKVGNTVARSPGPGVHSWMNGRERIPVDQTKTYRFGCYGRSISGAGSVAAFGIALFDAAGANISGDGTQAWYIANGIQLPVVWTPYTANVGAGTSRPFPANAVTMAPLFILSFGGGTTVHEVQDIVIEDVTQAVDAQTAAASAASAAAAAQTSADTANTALAAISSDSVLSRGEKPQVVQDWLAVDAERAGIVAQANAYSITTERDAYTTAHDALDAYLSGLSPAYNDTSVDTNISGASFRLYWVQLYEARQALLNKIAEVAGQRAVWANVSGSGKPADNATVGATFGVNVNGQASAVHIAENAATAVYTTTVAGPITSIAESHTPDGFSWQTEIAKINFPSGPAPDLGSALVIVVVSVSGAWEVVGGTSGVQEVLGGLHTSTFDGARIKPVFSANAAETRRGQFTDQARFIVQGNSANSFSFYAKVISSSGGSQSLSKLELRVEVIKR